MDTIINLVSASGSGKTTIAKHLEKTGLNIIQSYTTRPERKDDEFGHTFIEGEWVSDMFIVYKNGGCFLRGDMVAYLYEYGHHYFATKDQYQNKGVSLYIVDGRGAEEVRQTVKDARVITIFLSVDRNVRYERMVESRGRDAADRRIIRDDKLFTVCRCDYVVDGNGCVEDTVRAVQEIVGGIG